MHGLQARFDAPPVEFDSANDLPAGGPFALGEVFFKKDVSSTLCLERIPDVYLKSGAKNPQVFCDPTMPVNCISSFTKASNLGELVCGRCGGHGRTVSESAAFQAAFEFRSPK